MDEQATIISLRGVERTFSVRERQVKALRGIDLEVQRGSLVVLMGPSGSGKTTLLNLVGGLDHPTAGTVKVEGQRLNELSGPALAALLRALVDHEHVTLLMATHDPVAADFATDLYQLRDGQIASREPRHAAVPA